MNNLDFYRKNSFYYFIFIVIFLYITNNQLSQKNILILILLGIIIYFYLYYSYNNNNNLLNLNTLGAVDNSNTIHIKNNNRKNNIMNSTKYPFIFKNKEILNIYSNLSILSYYNIVSFKDSLYYINMFLKLFYILKEQDLTKYNNNYYIEQYFEYAKEGINLLYSIIINIPSQDGIYFDFQTSKDTSIETPTDKLLNHEITNLINIIESIKEIIIEQNNIYNSDYRNVNNQTNFIHTNLANNLNSKSLIQSFNLY